MREISCAEVTRAVRQLCIEANTQLPGDLCEALERAAMTEESPVGRGILGDIVENFHFAGTRDLPICQDTGMAVIFAELGQEVHMTGGAFEDAVNEGVARGYVEGHLRCSVVADPLRRVNTENNTPAILHLRLVPGDRLRIIVAPKGFGSENMTALHMFKPSASREDILDFITSSVDNAGSNPCPPIVVGVGLGGTAEWAAEQAKRALLRPVGQFSPDPFYQDMEQEALARINALGIGPQGLGGSTTALSVAILAGPTHIAGLPCAVSLGCHVTRHAEIFL
ncbi:MAG: fumarate hydratase [Pseudoflavonifractor sp.]|nr:fumarate hydratase [Pseudoflavonifractor sp.]